MNEKRLWRQRCREIRGVRAREAGPMLEEAFERCLEEVKTGTIGICWPFGSESDLRAAALRWCGDDSARRLAVPAVEETGIRYRLWEKDTPLTKDRAGLTVPDAEAVFPDLIFVPALGYSSQGHRLGYGGGYFDRFLAESRPKICVLIAFEAQKVPASLFAAHDLRFDALITEKGLTNFP